MGGGWSLLVFHKADGYVMSCLYFFSYISDDSTFCHVCAEPIFNFHKKCAKCDRIACLNCDFYWHPSHNKSTQHIVYPAIIHSRLNELEQFVTEAQLVMHEWMIREESWLMYSSKMSTTKVLGFQDVFVQFCKDGGTQTNCEDNTQIERTMFDSLSGATRTLKSALPIRRESLRLKERNNMLEEKVKLLEAEIKQENVENESCENIFENFREITNEEIEQLDIKEEKVDISQNEWFPNVQSTETLTSCLSVSTELNNNSIIEKTYEVDVYEMSRVNVHGLIRDNNNVRKRGCTAHVYKEKRCLICKEHLGQVRALIYHLEDKHGIIDTYRCEYRKCKKGWRNGHRETFFGYKPFEDHIDRVHKSTCTHCGKR